jgi:hypothetical protein
MCLYSRYYVFSWDLHQAETNIMLLIYAKDVQYLVFFDCVTEGQENEGTFLYLLFF